MILYKVSKSGKYHIVMDLLDKKSKCGRYLIETI